MTKADLIEAIAKQKGVPKDTVKKGVDLGISIIEGSLKDDEDVVLDGLGIMSRNEMAKQKDLDKNPWKVVRFRGMVKVPEDDDGTDRRVDQGQQRERARRAEEREQHQPGDERAGDRTGRVEPVDDADVRGQAIEATREAPCGQREHQARKDRRRQHDQSGSQRRPRQEALEGRRGQP